MKKLFVMAAMVLSSVGAFAQTTIQPKVGLNVSTIGDFDWKAGFAVGAELQTNVAPKLDLAAGLLYSVQGAKEDSDFGDAKWNPGYLNIPVTLNYYVVPGLAVKAGVQPGFMVNKDDAEGVKTFDLSIPVGLSYEYQNIVFDARYNIGVTKVIENWDHYNNVIQITVGYKFAL